MTFLKCIECGEFVSDNKHRAKVTRNKKYAVKTIGEYESGGFLVLCNVCEDDHESISRALRQRISQILSSSSSFSFK